MFYNHVLGAFEETITLLSTQIKFSIAYIIHKILKKEGLKLDLDDIDNEERL